MHIVLLLHQASDSASHGDHVIVRVGGEDDDSFWIGLSPLWTRAVIDIWFSARPARDGVLQFVEHFNIHQTGLSAELLNEVPQTVIYIILGREFQQGLTCLVTEVDDLSP